MDSVRELIVRRANASGHTLSWLSKEIGKNHAYLQQFVRRGVPVALPEEVRPKLATLLGVNEEDLRSTARSARPNGEVIRRTAARGVNLSGGDIPIFGPAPGDGDEIAMSDPIDVLRPPHFLTNTRGGYGILVTRENMAPALRPGDIALVNPHLPPRAGDEVVLQRDDHGAPAYGLIKTFVRATPNEWRLQQWNPKREIVKLKRDWPECHAVIGKYSRR